MTLSEIISRGIQVQLHEAVAIVRDVIDRGILATSSPFPDLHQVDLLGSGRVEVLGGGAIIDPVQGLLDMVQALIQPAPLPTQLALLANYPPPSVDALSEALAYFERPNRPAILQELHGRVTGVEPVTDPDVLIASLRATATSAPSAAAADGEHEARKAVQRRNLLVAAAIVGGVAALVLAVTVVLRGGKATDGTSPTLTSRVSEGVSGVAAAVGGAVTALGERVGLSSPPPPPSSTAQVEVPASPAPAPAPAARRGQTPPATKTSGPVSSTGPVLPVEDHTPVTLVPDLPSPATTGALEPPASSAGADAGAIYSPASTDVTPPVAVRPQLPKVVAPSARGGPTARIELVVGTDGAVEAVKLLGQPRTVHDSMLLSAAKAWRFRPALKDGVPVRYRTVVTVLPREPR